MCTTRTSSKFRCVLFDLIQVRLAVAGYVAYHERRLHARENPGMHSFLVSTVTETRSRAEELRKDLYPLIPRAGWRDAYLFIPLEDLTLATLLPRAGGTGA